MKIVCDRCEKEKTDFDHASISTDWGRLLLTNSSTKFYLCPDCYDAFFNFLEMKEDAHGNEE